MRALMLLLLLSACGGEEETPKPKKKTTPTDVPSGVVVNAETGTAGPGADAVEVPDATKDAVYASLMLASYADAVDALLDDAAPGAGDLSGLERGYVCATTGAGASQAVARLSGEARLAHTVGTVTTVLALTASGTETRTWTPPAGQSISCAAADGAPAVRWDDDALVDGLTVAVEADKRLTIERSVRRGETVVEATAESVRVAGMRAVTFAKGGGTDATYSYRTKSITGKTTRASSTATSVHEVVAKAPLLVTTRRVRSDGSLKEKKLVSGVMTTTTSGGVRIETSFHDLLFDLSASSTVRCRPLQGMMIARVLGTAGSTIALRTLTLRFSRATDGGVTLAYARDIPKEVLGIDAVGCELAVER